MSCVFVFVSSRDESEVYLAGLGTVGMEIFEQVPKVDAVVVPAAGQYGLLAGTAAAIKHLNSQITVIVSEHTRRCNSLAEARLPFHQMVVDLLQIHLPKHICRWTLEGGSAVNEQTLDPGIAQQCRKAPLLWLLSSALVSVD